MQGGADVKEPGKKSLEFRFSSKFFPEPQKCPPGRCPVLTLGGQLCQEEHLPTRPSLVQNTGESGGRQLLCALSGASSWSSWALC